MSLAAARERIAEIEMRLEECEADNVLLANQRDELLDALEALVGAAWADFTDDDTNMQPELKAARAAIAKTKGQA